jgi:hypothetical protein
VTRAQLEIAIAQLEADSQAIAREIATLKTLRDAKPAPAERKAS